MAEPKTDFELAHVLFMDVVGYSKMLIDDQREGSRELNAIVRGTEQFRSADKQGKLVCLPTGDGMALAFFTTPDAPVRCAIEIARALKDRPEIELRMGIHCGPVSKVADVNEHANIAGGGANMAQRVMDCGDAGHILLSQRVAEDLAQFREWNASLHDLGESEVKHGFKLHLFNFCGDGFGNPATPHKIRASPSTRRRERRVIPVASAIAVLTAVALVGAAVKYLLSRGEKAGASKSLISEKSIAVLPFENLSDDKGNAYFVDGIQDEILTRLAKVADLKVISRTSTQQFKSKPGNLSEIAKQLGVAHVLEGSAQRAVDHVRVNVQLIKAANDSHVWAETYDRKLTDVFAVETDIATKVADSLQAKLSGAEHQAMTTRPTENMEAHELYLKGRALAGKRTADDLKRAIDYYNEALTRDPNYALAYAGIADGYTLLQEYSSLPGAEAFPKARAAAEKALALDNDLAEAHSALGLVLQTADMDLKGAKREFERAIELNPNYAGAHYFLGLVVLAPLGHIEDAIAEVKRAVELDPFSAIINANLGYCYILAGRYPEAITQLQKTIQLAPKFGYTFGCLGIAFELSGRTDEAIAQYQKADQLQVVDYHGLTFLSHIYGTIGQQEKALQIFNQVKAVEEQKGEVWAFGHALMELGLGNNEQAIDWLERSYQAKESGIIVYIKVDRMLDPLRGNPRFETLANKIIPPDSK
ncbi:MAG TPA: tetratricopeptide repeat protein [Chthoniobacterales bacterium]